jgi:hypothetical protein
MSGRSVTTLGNHDRNHAGAALLRKENMLVDRAALLGKI